MSANPLVPPAEKEEEEKRDERRAVSSEYLDKHDIRTVFHAALNEIMETRPADVPGVLSQIMRRRASPAVIARLSGREVLDSRGVPTVEVDVFVAHLAGVRLLATAAAPSGVPCAGEARELRDAAPRFFQRGVQAAVRSVDALSRAVAGLELCDLGELDRRLCAADGTDLKENLGVNALCAASFALAEAAARLLEVELFEYLADQFYAPEARPRAFAVPAPLVTLVDGGRSAGGDTRLKAFMLAPRADVPFPEQLRISCEIYSALGDVLRREIGPAATGIGCCGGYAVSIRSNDRVLELIERAVQVAGYDIGRDVGIAINAAVQELFIPQAKGYEVEPGVVKAGDDLVAYWTGLIERHPAIVSIEDPLDDKDGDAWARLNAALAGTVELVGGAVIATNPKTAARAVEGAWCGAVTVKVGQIGTISEAMEVARLALAGGRRVVLAQRSGETAGSLIADLAVAVGAHAIRAGAPARGERVQKYTRLLQIYECLRARDQLVQ